MSASPLPRFLQWCMWGANQHDKHAVLSAHRELWLPASLKWLGL